MNKIILVDDERIALEHTKSLLAWDEYGFEIMATATNGRSALRLCEEIRPHIMIVDIRMPVMDGLALIRAVSERKIGVKFIVMSAYEDFDYARQAISIGSVSSYLIKHEVDRNKLLLELNKAKESWEADENQRRMQRSDQLKEMITGTGLPLPLEDSSAAPPFGMLLVQKDVPFSAVPSVNGGTGLLPSLKWSFAELSRLAEPTPWQLVGEFALNRTQLVALFSQKNRADCTQRDSFKDLVASLQVHLNRQNNQSKSIYYSFQCHDSLGLRDSFRRVEAAARHAVFCGNAQMLCVDDLPLLPLGSENYVPALHHEYLEMLVEGMGQNDLVKMENAIKNQFHSLGQQRWNLPGLYETVHTLSGLLNKRNAALGLPEIDPLPLTDKVPLYHIDDIMNSYILLFRKLFSSMGIHDRLSNKLLRALKHIQEHFHEDIAIEDVSHATGISPSYLHQLFKRELSRTFLDYLTEHRINQAKLILSREDAKMTEVCARVGYRSPQHFSQVFKKTTGMLPHQFRHGGHHL